MAWQLRSPERVEGESCYGVLFMLPLAQHEQ